MRPSPDTPRLVADNDNYRQRDIAIRRQRGYGTTLRVLARRYGLHVSKIRRICNKRLGVEATSNTVVKNILVLGARGSTSCYYQPVSLPRIKTLHGEFGAAA